MRQRRRVQLSDDIFVNFVNPLILPRPGWALRVYGYRIQMTVAANQSNLDSANEEVRLPLFLLSTPEVDTGQLTSNKRRHPAAVLDQIWVNYRQLGTGTPIPHIWDCVADSGWVTTDLKMWGVWLASVLIGGLHATDDNVFAAIIEYEWEKVSPAEYVSIGMMYGLDILDWKNEPGLAETLVAGPSL